MNRGEAGLGEAGVLTLQVEAVVVKERMEPTKVDPFVRSAPSGCNSHDGTMK